MAQSLARRGRVPGDADSETWAVPVLLPNGLIVRDATGLLRVTLGS